jgi:hypothetical protein
VPSGPFAVAIVTDAELGDWAEPAGCGLPVDAELELLLLPHPATSNAAPTNDATVPAPNFFALLLFMVRSCWLDVLLQP